MFQFYKPNREWAVLNAVMERRSEVFENSSVDYAALTLTLARQSALHEASVVIPAIGKRPDRLCALVSVLQIVKQGAGICNYGTCISWRIILKNFCLFSVQTVEFASFSSSLVTQIEL
jgi:hypothetical protein